MDGQPTSHSASRSAGRLRGKVAVVTGAGQGIGRGIALALAGEGATVVVTGRTVAQCERVAQELTALGAEVLPLACDVGDREQMARTLNPAVERVGGLDALVNNAQASRRAPLADITDAEAEECWRSGALGTLYAMQAAFPHLRARGGDAIVQLRVQRGDGRSRDLRRVRDGEGGDPRLVPGRGPGVGPVRHPRQRGRA